MNPLALFVLLFSLFNRRFSNVHYTRQPDRNAFINNNLLKCSNLWEHPNPEAACFKMWVCGRLLVGIAGSNPVGSMDICLFLVSVVCFQVEVSATGRCFFQRRPTDCVRACVCVCVSTGVLISP